MQAVHASTPAATTRWKAGGIHLAISCVMATAALALIFLIWYPGPYFRASGGDRLVLLLIGIDLVAGPLLTLIVYKAGKKGLKFDLAVIASVQVAALVYGMHVIAQARPAFVVATQDRFNVVSANMLNDEDLTFAPEALRSLSWTGPRVIAALMPTDPKARDAVLTSALQGKDLQLMPKYYADISRGAADLLAHAKPLDELAAIAPTNGSVIDAALERFSLTRDKVRWVPLAARNADLAMLLDAASGAPIAPIDARPWKD